jgi:putative nucleotidyltransferase with HDIG domain
MDKNLMMERAEIVVGAVDDLPTIPIVATKVLQLLDNPDVNVDAVADLMLTDQVMTARVMKLLNSPVYKPTQEISSLKRALVYLGLRHIRELVLTTSVIHAFDTTSGALELNSFWEHSFGVGMVSKIIAQKVGFQDLEKAYISGILHDLGEVFLSNFLREPFLEVLEHIKTNQIKLVDAEAELLGTTHCEIGLSMARKWNFPDSYRDVIAYHHDPGHAKVDPVLCSIVNLADLFCSVRGLNYGGREWISFNLSTEEAWAILVQASPGMAQMDEERFCYELDDAIPEVTTLVSSIFTP